MIPMPENSDEPKMNKNASEISKGLKKRWKNEK